MIMRKLHADLILRLRDVGDVELQTHFGEETNGTAAVRHREHSGLGRSWWRWCWSCCCSWSRGRCGGGLICRTHTFCDKTQQMPGQF